MSKFRTPVRRSIRQRSGYTVSGKTTGGECKLVNTASIVIKSSEFQLTFEKEVEVGSVFQLDRGLIAFGGYIYCSNILSIEIELLVDNCSKYITKKNEIGKWCKLGTHLFIELNKPIEKKIIKAKIKFNSTTSSIGEIDFYGFDLDSTRYYLDKHDHYESFNQMTNLYIPEIYYFESEKPFAVLPIEYPKLNFTTDKCVIIKSCNRCARYLLIDLEDETYSLSFSNHCRNSYPCNHASFSRFKLVENKCKEIPSMLANRIETNSKYCISVYGFQLECRVCKKYYVNYPLNPKRNSTQHREDGLRRRAFEDLISRLYNRELLFYHFYRIKNNKEFDVYIWEKFGKRCFKCSNDLDVPKNMALDHTMPLLYLWPLNETATCLCSTCNSQKSGKFPIEFYSLEDLKKLSSLTGICMEILTSKEINKPVFDKLKKEVIWLFDTFLADEEYQKERDGKLTADLIYNAIKNVVKRSGEKFDFVESYEKLKHKKPKSITLK